MPPTEEPYMEKSLADVVEEIGLYPLDAYEFVQCGLSFTVRKVHAETIEDPEADHHVSGRQLCEGLREFALMQWGMLAGTVLRRWNITSTMDFGRIVFALVENNMLRKTDQDTIDDFRNVYDFRSVFDAGYRITSNA